MPQLTFAQGTHQLHVGRDQVRHLRADVVRCLLDQDFYIASPWAIFALTAPPSLEPEFALQTAALSLLKRALSPHCKAQAFGERLETFSDTCDGPYARAAQLKASNIYGPGVMTFCSSASSHRPGVMIFVSASEAKCGKFCHKTGRNILLVAIMAFNENSPFHLSPFGPTKQTNSRH